MFWLWLYCVSKCTGHWHNNLYPLKNRKYFQCEKNHPLCLISCTVCVCDFIILRVILTLKKNLYKTNLKRLPFRRHLDYACSQKCNFQACVKKRGDT